MSKNYNTCDGIYTIFNTLYLTIGISIIVISITILLILLLIAVADIAFFRHFVFILIYFNLLVMPFILTHLHIKNIKYKCSNNKIDNNITNIKKIEVKPIKPIDERK